MHGGLLYTSDPTNLFVQNVNFDFDYAIGGWIVEVNCNYPEAILTGEVVYVNHTIYSGSGKMVSMLNGYFSYTGP